MTQITKQVEAGQAVYTKLTLAIYDLWVLGISNRFIWKCSSSHLLEHYNQHISGNHLDLGVGTGFFLDLCTFPTNNPRIVLMDLNPNSLEVTSRRLARYHPVSYRRNVLEPIQFDGQGFDSVGLNYLLHCLPGTILTKAVVFENILPLLNPNGVIFGSTLLTVGVERGFLAQRLMDFYNKKGIFNNKNDNLEDLKKILEKNFSESSVKTIGCVALFWGRL
ncbi:class I SAM-dependent methyltransferase [Pleurocapsales cyanobacterium LEGE 06147]|nr:class I SAM-dependent methyltransferase [Pleurocapsales cyanobacterium LEGE 06147]